MNPTPLTSPSGTVYSYACGVCKHIATTGEYMHENTDEDVSMLAESSRERAERCCRCTVCGTPHRRGEFLSLWSGHCESCATKERHYAEQHERAIAEMPPRPPEDVRDEAIAAAFFNGRGIGDLCLDHGLRVSEVEAAIRSWAFTVLDS